MSSRPSIGGDTSPYQLAGDTQYPGQDNVGVKDTGNDNREPEKKPNRFKGLLIGGIVVIAITAAWFVFNSEKQTDKVTEAITEQTINQPKVVPDELAERGNVVLKGRFGAVAATFEMDFSTGSGKRYYNSAPADFYTLKIAKVTPLPDGDFMIEIHDLLDGRINIGTYRGTFKGDSFSGTYTSNHGTERQFSFE